MGDGKEVGCRAGWSAAGGTELGSGNPRTSAREVLRMNARLCRPRSGYTVVAVLILGLLASACGRGGGPEQSGQAVEYVFPTSSDYSGPYADVMPQYDAGRKACANWWNDNVGSRLGVRMRLEHFDSHYDTSVIASQYPRLLQQYRPIGYLGFGAPDTAALLGRLPDDKVVMINATAASSFEWKPNSWLIRPRATYTHEYAGWLEWRLSQWREARPLRVAILNVASPGTTDWEKGITRYINAVLKPRGKAEVVRIEYSPAVPVDVSGQMSRILAANPDVLFVLANTSMVVAALNAMDQLGKRVPIVMSSHNGLSAVARALGGYERLEGSYEVFGILNDAVTDAPAISEAWKKYGSGEWTIDALQGCVQTLLAGAGLKRAVEKHGARGLTGEQLYAAFDGATIGADEMLGLTYDLHFTRAQPFPTQVQVQVGTVRDGRHVLASDGWVRVPEVPRW